MMLSPLDRLLELRRALALPGELEPDFLACAKAVGILAVPGALLSETRHFGCDWTRAPRVADLSLNTCSCCCGRAISRHYKYRSCPLCADVSDITPGRTERSLAQPGTGTYAETVKA
jgi:hypothetical protein